MQAGRTLASQLAVKYRYENCATIALTPGGVMVAAQIAMELHTVLTLLLSEEIKLPMEPVALAGISQDGSFSYNEQYSKGEIDEFMGEYYQVVEQEKMSKLQEMQRILGSGNVIRRDLIYGRNIILVSDGFDSAFSLDLAMQYLKPIKVGKIIVATPLASLKAVDRMHILADDIYCLSVIEDYMDTPHYYDTQDVPTPEKSVEIIEKIILNWK